jgi:hypothetical protein
MKLLTPKPNFLTLLCAFAISLAAQATTVEELLDADRLQLRSWLLPAQNIVPGQQIKLNIEVATDRWFTGGTRIKIPEIPGLVILQTDDFASNSSEQRRGQSWVVQRWSLEIYAQTDGQFKIPPITASVKVSGDNGQNIEGEVRAPALEFSAARPEALSRAQHWVAAPNYKISQSFDRSLDGLQVGDALARQIDFRAGDVMAMMLPAFAEEGIEGLTAYPEPPVLNNNSNRGTVTASRTERIVYIAEEPGEYRLPAQDFYWWDTTTAQVQMLTLASVDVLVGASGTSTQESKPSPTPGFRFLAPWLMGLLALGVLIWLVGKIPFAAITQRCRKTINLVLQKWRKFRQPALPAKLNPGNSAE